MKDTSTRKLAKLGRRNFLKQLSALGLSAGALRYLTQDALADLTDDPSDEVPVLKGLHAPNPEELKEPPYPELPIEREPIFVTIPRDRFVKIFSTYAAEAKVNNEIKTALENAGAQGDSISPWVTTRNDGGRRKRVVVVQRTSIEYNDEVLHEPNISAEELRKKLPSAVDGAVGEGENREVVENIPVYVEEAILSPDNGCSSHFNCGDSGSHYDGEYRPVPGGCKMVSETAGWAGTIGTPAYDNSISDIVYLTAGHNFYDFTSNESPSDGENRDMYQPTYYNTAGTSDRVKCYLNSSTYSDYTDGATVTNVGQSTPTYRLADPTTDDLDETVSGMVSMSYISTMEDNDEELCKQGQTNGRCSGEVVAVSSSTKTFQTDATTGSGDSGGPHFYTSNDNAYIAGIHHGSYNGNAMAYSAEDFESDFNVSIP